MLPPVREECRQSSSRSHRRGRGVIVADRLGVTVAVIVIATAIKTEFVVVLAALAAVVAIDIAVNIAIVAQGTSDQKQEARKPQPPGAEETMADMDPLDTDSMPFLVSSSEVSPDDSMPSLGVLPFAQDCDHVGCASCGAGPRASISCIQTQAVAITRRA